MPTIWCACFGWLSGSRELAQRPPWPEATRLLKIKKQMRAVYRSPDACPRHRPKRQAATPGREWPFNLDCWWSMRSPQSADSGGVLGNLGESARELILKRLSSREWACHYGWSKRQAATSGCAVRRMKTLRADFRKGGCKNPLITMTLGAGGFK